MDNFKDLEELGINDDDEQSSDFQVAANRVQTLASKLENDDLLLLYGFYKQGLEGNCNVSKPSWYDFRAKSKWEAWNVLKDMPKLEAQQKYIQLVAKLDPSFADDSTKSKMSTKEGWVTVSTLQKPDDSDDDQDEDELSVAVKAGDHVAVEHLLSDPKSKYGKEFEWNRLDRDGIALIHWATDRGCTKIIKSLTEHGADVHAKDTEGQTALHYASSCGHLQCAELLLKLGVDPTVKDNDGADAIDAAGDDEMRELLRKGRLAVE